MPSVPPAGTDALQCLKPSFARSAKASARVSIQQAPYRLYPQQKENTWGGIPYLHVINFHMEIHNPPCIINSYRIYHNSLNIHRIYFDIYQSIRRMHNQFPCMYLYILWNAYSIL